MTKIFVMTHKKFAPPEAAEYIPLQVGRSGKESLGYLEDNTGDNISDLNCYYGELTGIYWLWKNCDIQENIGICHYRRYFINDKVELLSEQDYDDILSKYDIITSNAIYQNVSCRDMYAKTQNVKDLELVGKAISNLYPEDYPFFLSVINEKKSYFGNLMVTSRKYFDSYCEWLFSVFEEVEKDIDVSSYDEYHRRVFGFLSELLLLVWIEARNLKVYECKVGIFGEKAETKELKLAVGQLIKMGQIGTAKQMFYEVLKIRPDIMLAHSDVKKEIPIIGWILYICEMEEANGLEGLLAYSKELTKLIELILWIKDLFRKNEDWTIEEIAYLKECYVSEITITVIAKADEEFQNNWQSIVEKYYVTIGK